MNLLKAGDRLVEGEHQDASDREAGHQLEEQDARCGGQGRGLGPTAVRGLEERRDAL